MLATDSSLSFLETQYFTHFTNLFSFILKKLFSHQAVILKHRFLQIHYLIPAISISMNSMDFSIHETLMHLQENEIFFLLELHYTKFYRKDH